MRERRFAASAAFFCFGIVGGTLVPRMPSFKEGLGLTDGQVGITFLVYSAAALAGALLARPAMAGGARRPVRAGVVVLLVLMIGPAVAPDFGFFIVAFIALGLVAGFLDVFENSQAAEIERQAGRPMINSFHGYWSLGWLVGAIGAAAAASLAIAPLPHFAAVAVVFGLVSLPLLANVPNTRGGAATMVPGGTARSRVGVVVAAIAALAFFAIVIESAGGDWGPIYLRDISKTSLGFAAAAGVAFSVAMTAVRLTADRLTARTSAAVVAGAGALVAAVGVLLAVAMPAAPTAIAGFMLVGAGSAVVVPLAFSAGANLGRSGTALSVVTGAAYAGSIVGPFVIGSAGDAFGLRAALAIPFVAAVAVLSIAVGVRALRSRFPAAVVEPLEEGQAGATERS